MKRWYPRFCAQVLSLLGRQADTPPDSIVLPIVIARGIPRRFISN